MQMVINEKNKYKKYLSININNSFDVKKGSNNKAYGQIHFYDERMINQLVLKKINNGFKRLLEIIEDLDDADGDPSSNLLLCLNEEDKFKKEIMNKYRKLLQKKELEIINRKLEIIENDLKNKLIIFRMSNMLKISRVPVMEDYEEEKETTRRR